jgi:S1-C subfamily serine protease
MKYRIRTVVIALLGSLPLLLFAPRSYSVFYDDFGIHFGRIAAIGYVNVICDVLDRGRGHCALATSADEQWSAASAIILDSAKIQALNRCRQLSLQPTSCKVVDEDMKSPFIANLTGRSNSTVQATAIGDRFLIGTGTGFVINDEYVVTADHVLEECDAVSIRHQHKEIEGEIAARDTNNDLGLIRLDEKFKSSAKLRDGKPTTLGEMVANYGYPLFGQLSDAAKVTQGNINALAGWQNDSSILQFDAPTQPGNSGGPLLDASANVVGVVSSSLSKEYAIQTDHIAQNVNFAVKSYLIEGFLTANGVTYKKAESKEELSLPQIAEKAEAFTVLVGCWQ